MYVPVLQVNKVLQVELSGVLSEIDGVHILKEVKMTTGEKADRKTNLLRKTKKGNITTYMKTEIKEKRKRRSTDPLDLLSVRQTQVIRHTPVLMRKTA